MTLKQQGRIPTTFSILTKTMWHLRKTEIEDEENRDTQGLMPEEVENFSSYNSSDNLYSDYVAEEIPLPVDSI